jgi:hypothetical protein
MTEDEFCKLYTSYYGEEISSIKQLVKCNMSGEELYEFSSQVKNSVLKEAIEKIEKEMGIVGEDLCPKCKNEATFQNWDYYCDNCGIEFADGKGLISQDYFIKYVVAGLRYNFKE